MKPSNSQTIVITAASGISPLGHNLADIAANLGRSPEQTGCGSSRQLGSSALWSISGLDDSSFLGTRLKRKLDMFTVYGLVASGMALQQSQLDLPALDPSRIGIYVGNCLGGWGYTEPELKALHTQGINGMGPYVATAWFPAALQGQISLAQGFKGQSKTFSARDVAGIQAIGHACAAIANGRVDVVLCGASEDLSSSYMQTILQRLQQSQWPCSAPFGAARYPVLAEGAAFLVLERKDHAIARGATILAEISGFADRFCAQPQHAASALQRARQALGGEQASLLVPDGVFEHEADLLQQQSTMQGITCSANPRHTLGLQFAVSGVMETALLAQALHQERLHARTLGPVSAPDNGERLQQALIQRLSGQGQISMLALQKSR